MKGWIIYFRTENELDGEKRDYGTNRIIKAGPSFGVDFSIYRPDQFELIINRNDNKSILIDGVPHPPPDFVLPRTGSGTTYFTRAILRQLNYLGVPCINSVSTVKHVGDKLYASQLLAQSSLPTPPIMLAKPNVNPELVEKEIGFPAVIKNQNGTGGKGIHLCQNIEQFQDVIDLIYSNNPTASLVVQEYIAASYGKDIRLLVVGKKVVGCMQRIARKGFKANISLGGEVAPFPLNPQLEQLASDVCTLFDLEIGGIDLLFTDSGDFTVCEANSAPGFLGMEKITGPVIAEHIIEYIIKRVKAHQQQIGNLHV